MAFKVTEADLKKIEALEVANPPSKSFPTDPYRRSSGHFGYERPGDMGEFKKRRSWRPKEPGYSTPKAATKHSEIVRNAPHSAPAVTHKLEASNEFSEGLMNLSATPLVFGEESPLRRFNKRQSWQPSTPTSPRRRTRASVSTPSPSIEKRLLEFSSPTDQIPPAFQVMQRKKGEPSSPKKQSFSSPTYLRKSRDLSAIECISPSKKEIMTPQRLKKSVWPPVHKATSLTAKSSFRVEPGTVKSKRISFEIQNHGGVKPVLAPPLSFGDSPTESPTPSDGGDSSAKRPSGLNRQASLVIRWAGPTYYSIEGRPPYDDHKSIDGNAFPVDSPLVNDRFESARGGRSPLPPTRQLSDDDLTIERPNVWVAPANISSPHDDGKWKVKRVWYVSARDQVEEEIIVDDIDLMDKVKQLLGVPTGEAQSRREDGESPVYDPVAAKWRSKAVFDINGEIQSMQKTLVLDEAGLVFEFGTVVEEQIRMLIEDSEHSGSDLIAKWGFKEGNSGHSVEESAAKWAEKRRAALNASQSTSSRGDGDGWGDDEASFASDSNKVGPIATSHPKSAYESNQSKNGSIHSAQGMDGESSEKMNARWGYNEGGQNDDDENGLLPRATIGSANPGGESNILNGDARVEIDAKWVGDDEGGELFIDADNDVLPIKKPLHAEEEHAVGAKWSYDLGRSDHVDEEIDLLPVAKMAALQIQENNDSTGPLPGTGNEVVPTSEVVNSARLGTVDEMSHEGDDAKKAVEKKKKKKKKKKKGNDEEEHTIYDLLWRDAWFDS